jgi:V/A-type H+-transporting ATPase subunit C
MYVEYVNARVHGMASRLLDHHEMERLIAQTSVEGIIAELEKTPYSQDITEARILFSGISCVEQALRKNLARTYRKIFSLVRGEKNSRYVILFLKKWDIQNIKTILRGKNIQAPAEEIAGCLVPAGTLDETTLLELLKQPDVRGVIDLMATWQIEYSVPLTRHLGDYQEHHNLDSLEYALDEYYFSSSLEKITGNHEDDRVIRDLIQTEIDATNLKNVLIMTRDSVPPEVASGVIIPGGKVLSQAFLMEMLQTRDVSKAVRLLETSSYRFLLEVPPQEYQTGRISGIEKAIERFLIKKTLHVFRGDPFSFTIVIGYLRAKLNEIINIRVIARSREAGLPDSVMEAEMIYV